MITRRSLLAAIAAVIATGDPALARKPKKPFVVDPLHVPQQVEFPSGYSPGTIVVDTADGHYTFDSVYPALGSDTHVMLAEQLGAKLSDLGNIAVDSHQRTSVPGLYAAGDVVIGLDQISHAMGEGGVAATTIRNDLCAEEPRLREPIQEIEEAESGS